VRSVSQWCLTFVTPWTVACQAPLSMEFSRQEYWSGLLFPSLGHLPHPGIEPVSPASAGGFFITEPPGKPTKPLFIPTDLKSLVWFTSTDKKRQQFLPLPTSEVCHQENWGDICKKKKNKKLWILGVNSAISGSFTVLTASHGKHWIHLHTSL